MSVVTRFAPSPTGRMHAGNIFTSLISWLHAKSQGGEVVLRIEDLDKERSKQEFIELISKDYQTLGLSFDRGPYFQHNRDDVYEEYFAQLENAGLIYPCFCSRADLLSASAPHRGEKSVYSGRCKGLSESKRQTASQSRKPAFRVTVPEATYSFEDGFQGPYEQNLAEECGDFIVRRSDGAFAYQLAVVVDDAAQGINAVVRGVDLLCSTPQQLFLQDLFGFPHPDYFHVPLLVSDSGVRLSKRNKDASLEEMLQHHTPQEVIGHLAFISGLIDQDAAVTPTDLLHDYSPNKARELWQGRVEIPWAPLA